MNWRILFISIFLICLGADNQLTAQSHRPIFVKGRKWDVSDKYDFLYAQDMYRYFLLEQDTLIDGEWYQQLVRHLIPYYTDPNTPASYYYHDPYFVSFVREDTSSGQIWTRTLEDTASHLVFDFNWQVGDTVIYEIQGDSAARVWVESIYLENSPKGGMRRVFSMNSNGYHLMGNFREEIGGQNYPHAFPFNIFGNWLVYCVQDSDGFLFDQASFKACLGYTADMDELKTSPQVTLAIQYQDDYLHLALEGWEGPFPLHVEVYDLTGKRKFQQEIYQADFQIDTQSCQAGIYILACFGHEHFIFQKVSIKKN